MDKQQRWRQALLALPLRRQRELWGLMYTAQVNGCANVQDLLVTAVLGDDSGVPDDMEMDWILEQARSQLPGAAGTIMRSWRISALEDDCGSSEEEDSYADDGRAAHQWHSARRAAMLKSPRREGIVCLFGDVRSSVCTILAMLGLTLLHTFVTVRLAGIGGGAVGVMATVLLAATVGAFCAFGFQALNHELMHCPLPYAVRAAPALVGASFTAVPWFCYYFSGAHARHHQYAGSADDHDADALFWLWERVPKWCGLADTPLGGMLWLSIAALSVPFVIVTALTVCVIASPRTNIPDLACCVVETLLTVYVHASLCSAAQFGSAHAAAFLILSMAFANGFLCHPYLSFWLLQHWCAGSDIADHPDDAVAGGRVESEYSARVALRQPTMSYRGSPLVHWLFFNELRHVEHHDLSRVPWTRLHLLESACPEVYGKRLHWCTSVSSLIMQWLRARGSRLEFACRHGRCVRADGSNAFANHGRAYDPRLCLRKTQ